MRSFDAYIVFCIPMALGIAFMARVLWCFWREQHRPRKADSQAPILIHASRNADPDLRSRHISRTIS